MKALKQFSLLLTATSLLISLNSYSQSSSKEQKLESLLQKGKIEKCIEKSKKMSKKKKYKALGLFYETVATAELFKLSEDSRDSLKNMKRTLQILTRCERYNIAEEFPQKYPDLMKSLHDATSSFAEKLHIQGEERNAKYMYKQLAQVFKDTTAQYLVYFSIKKEISNTVTNSDILDSTIIKRIEIIKAAEKLVGVPYVYGGETTKGLDCSGFTQFVYKKAGIELPHNANMQSKMGNEIDITETQPGDLIFFGNEYNGTFKAFHAGVIYKNDNGKIDLIHCVSRGVTIDEDGASANGYWLKKNYIVKRMIN